MNRISIGFFRECELSAFHRYGYVFRRDGMPWSALTACRSPMWSKTGNWERKYIRTHDRSTFVQYSRDRCLPFCVRYLDSENVVLRSHSRDPIPCWNVVPLPGAIKQFVCGSTFSIAFLQSFRTPAPAVSLLRSLFAYCLRVKFHCKMQTIFLLNFMVERLSTCAIKSNGRGTNETNNAHISHEIAITPQ